MAAEENARFLLDKGFRPARPGDLLRGAVLRKLDEALNRGETRGDALQTLYPETILDDEVLETVTAALVSGSNVLFLGPPGSGKTSLARDLWNLYPKEVFVVADCPVQDDPFSLVDKSYAAAVPPCPYCKATHGAVSLREVGDFDVDHVDPAKIPVKKARLREGHGLARIQGSPEVFPDYLTGAINLAKLEELGDPNSPLVLEPGKLMQANRGLLMVDEVGKLPRGTQNVLLQALQENVVTPTKSRETFPANFVAATTSNTDDLDLINEPLTGRLSSVFVGFNQDHAKNRAIVDRALRVYQAEGTAIISGPFREAAVLVTERWRRTAEGLTELAEVGSNRTMIDILRRSEALTALAGRGAVTWDDFERAAREAMHGRVRGRSGESYFQNKDAVASFVKKQGAQAMRDAAVGYWCSFFEGPLNGDKSEGERVVRETREVVKDETRLAEALAAKEGKFAKFAKWAAYVDKREGKTATEDARLALHQAVWAAMEAAKAFDAPEAGKR